MKPIQKDELYVHLSSFLKKKGVELKEGPYTKGIHAGCSLLADAINLSQAGIQRARDEVAKQINEVRQVIHEKTAPRPPRVTPNPKASKPNGNNTNGTGKTAKKSRPAAASKKKARKPAKG